MVIAAGIMSLSLTLAIGVAGCGLAGDGGDAGDVKVSLMEYRVVPSPESAPAGSVTFNVENIGTATHEFVVIQTDLAPESLPVAADGSVDEAGAGIQVIDEIEDMEADATADLSVDLEAGAYVLLCNVVEEADGLSHYQEGMYSAFEVTP
jgi:hypothetical protein